MSEVPLQARMEVNSESYLLSELDVASPSELRSPIINYAYPSTDILSSNRRPFLIPNSIPR